MDTFGCLKLAYEAGKKSGNMPAIMNASNEVAVELFLNRGIEYLSNRKNYKRMYGKFQYVENPTLEEIIEVDSKVRDYVREKYKL